MSHVYGSAMQHSEMWLLPYVGGVLFVGVLITRAIAAPVFFGNSRVAIGLVLYMTVLLGGKTYNY